MPKAVTPFFLITGDEDYRDTLYPNDLKRHFGGEHKAIESSEVFAELKQKFRGNVFLIHRKYGDADERIVRRWQSVLDDEHVLRLGSDQAIADVTLGLFAIMTGSRTLEEYLDDMRTKRVRAQTDSRINEVRETLSPLLNIRPARRTTQEKAKEGEEAPSNKPPEKRKAEGGKKKIRL